MTMYAIISTFGNSYGATYSATLEYCESTARVLQRMRDWAGWHGSIDRLSPDGLYFDKADGTAFRAEPVAAEEAQL